MAKEEIPGATVTKAQEAGAEHDAAGSHGPAAAAAAAGSSADAVPDEPAPAYVEQEQHKQDVTVTAPSVASPFDFPAQPGSLPAYADHHHHAPPPAGGSGRRRPVVAIPQRRPDAASPFLDAYPPGLLAHGITVGTWRSFVETASAFLTAKVSDRALSHAADMAKDLAEPHRSLGRDVADRCRRLGRDVAADAKRGNVVGAALGVVGGAVGIPVAAALGAVGATLSLPDAAVGAVARRPRTPARRAADYAAVANDKWLHARGVHAHIAVGSAELASCVGVPAPDDILDKARRAADQSAAGQVRALEDHIAPLEVPSRLDTLELGHATMWLVLLPLPQEEGES